MNLRVLTLCLYIFSELSLANEGYFYRPNSQQAFILSLKNSKSCNGEWMRGIAISNISLTNEYANDFCWKFLDSDYFAFKKKDLSIFSKPDKIPRALFRFFNENSLKETYQNKKPPIIYMPQQQRDNFPGGMLCHSIGDNWIDCW